MGTRSIGWEMRLTRVIRDWRKVEYSWENNCVIFAGDCVLAVTGADPVADLRGKITGVRDWAYWLRREGGLADAATRRLGDPIAPDDAIMGDILMCDGALGVHIGQGGAFLKDIGLGLVPVSGCDLAWGVGRG